MSEIDKLCITNILAIIISIMPRSNRGRFYYINVRSKSNLGIYLLLASAGGGQQGGLEDVHQADAH
jgi:hypothetical protein